MVAAILVVAALGSTASGHRTEAWSCLAAAAILFALGAEDEQALQRKRRLPR